MTVLVAGGGTGGHLYPALALIEALCRRYGDALEVSHVGTARGLESAVLADRVDVERHEIRARGFLRESSVATIRALMDNAVGLGQALAILRRVRPQVVIGTGGYASFAPVLGATLLGIPTAIHEQNVCPGLVTRVLAPRVDHVFLSFPDTERRLNARRTSVVGVPLRREIRQLRNRSPRDAKVELGLDPNGPLVLALGGSNGAQSINDALLQGCRALRDREAQLAVIAGRDAERLRRTYPHVDCPILEHTSDIGLWMQGADVAVSRAGGATLSELVTLGVPTIAVPWLGAADDHQTANARWFAERGACRRLDERNLDETRLLNETLSLLDGSADRAAMRDVCNRLAQTEAHDHLMREVERYLRHDSHARVVPLYRHRRRWHERLGLAAARARARGERIGSSR